MPLFRPDRRALYWILVLDAAAVLGSLAAACLMPFTGLAVAAALTLPLDAAVATVLGGWATNQAIGFGLLGYPADGETILRGVGSAVAALVALGVGRLGRTAGGSIVVTRAVVAFAAAFAAYEATLYAFALVLGGTENFTPAIVWLIGRTEALGFAGLMVIAVLLRRTAPATFGSAAVRLA